ncbi:sel1 repeat family protein [Streptomyces phaeochromogenes]|uniref:sel1 repeat family protein n=1 Tax=Streptomyces phaeochromogenes TaxID=1923 RepID=UPI0036CB10CD
MGDIFSDLKRVGALKRELLSGQPSDRQLARLAGVSHGTAGRWLEGAQFPQDRDGLIRVLGAIRAEAAARGVLDSPADNASGDTVAQLLDAERWYTSFEAERKRRAQESRADTERHQARSAMEGEAVRARLAALSDPPRPVRAWSARRLGVHPAIPGHPVAPGGRFVLPRYVLRPHDAELRTNLSAAIADGAAPRLVVVEGGSCTGKSRAAFEAVRAVVPEDFDLFFPADAAGLLEALAADALRPGSLLWLNEAQDYLVGPDGEAVAAALLRRLDRDGPLLVVATLWPDHRESLTATVPFGTHDPHRQARTLLAQAHRVVVPRTFAGSLEAARDAAWHDPALADALRTGTAELAQVLAAGPDLVDHYENPHGQAGVHGWALMRAAMDAHRLGATGPLPLAFLEEAAAGYLDAADRTVGPDWFTHALAYARTDIKHTTQALQEVARISGMGVEPGVLRLADYLAQHGRRAHRADCPPLSFWEAAHRHLTRPDDLASLAGAAGRRLRRRWASRLWFRAADLGSSRAMSECARWLWAEDREAGERLARKAAGKGDFSGLASIAFIPEHTGDFVEAERISLLAAAEGGTFGLRRLSERRLRTGDTVGAERNLRQAGDAGDMEALLLLAGLRWQAGDQEEAKRLVTQAAEADDIEGLAQLASLRMMDGDRDQAEQLAGRVMQQGSARAWNLLGDVVEQRGDLDEARSVLRQAADEGDETALARLAWIAESLGARGESARLLQEALQAGHTDAVANVAVLRHRIGNSQAAEHLAREIAERGDDVGYLRLAEARAHSDDLAGATAVLQAAIEGGSLEALVCLARMHEKAGDDEAALPLLRQAVAAGRGDARVSLALLCVRADRDEAEEIADQAADAGFPEALSSLADRRQEAGDHEEAERIRRRLAAEGYADALIALAEQSAREGDRDEAARLLVRAADFGDETTDLSLARVWKHGLEPDGLPSGPWSWAELEKLGPDGALV